ncbi:MAG TPA: hypothetical protein C5S50_05900 [Methanosarcinaceae archaeon]|nr:hypothetical protein [Methanosarcinaceae archaeon]
MNNEKMGAIGLLFIFLILTVGVLAYSLPSNIYSPQRGSATEVSLMEYSNYTNTLFLRSHIFINSPKPTDVIVTSAVPFRMISTQPPADISDKSVGWKGVFSKRSQLHFKEGMYTDLYYEASVPFENPIDITLEFEGDVIRADIVNNGAVPVEDIFVHYYDGGQHIGFAGYLPLINANSNTLLELNDQHPSNDRLVNIMKNDGISKYAGKFLFANKLYPERNIISVRGSYDRTWAWVAYQLPESLHDDVVSITITPSPTQLHRFAWVSIHLDKIPERHIENTGTTSIIKLDEDHHHLGDNVDTALVPNEPEGVSYSTMFTTDLAAGAAELVLTTKNVVPRNASKQFQDNVYINGEYIGKLNDYVINETQDYAPRTVSISFDPALLHPFDNTIEITSGANTEATNYDDFEFYNLKIVIYLNRQMPIIIPEPIPES